MRSLERKVKWCKCGFERLRLLFVLFFSQHTCFPIESLGFVQQSDKCLSVRGCLRMATSSVQEDSLPAKLDTERDIILYQVYHFAAIGKIDPEVTTSASSTRFESCIWFAFKINALHSAFVQEGFFDIVLKFHRNRYRLDMCMSTLGTQATDFEKDGHISMLRIIGTKGGFVSEKWTEPSVSPKT